MRGMGGGLLLLLFLTACSTTKYVPDDDQLFVGLKKITYTDYEDNDHATETQEELEAALATQPNGALFGSSYYRTPFPYGLWVWNATHDAKTRFGKWLNATFGKAPVLMSQVNPALRAQVARQVLFTNGYMHGNVSYAEVPQKNPKKAKIAYTVHMDSLFRVDTMSYVGFPSDMRRLIDSTLVEAETGAGKPFSMAALEAERTRLGQLMRNNGYFYYQPSYASFLADTFGVANRVKLRMQMADSLPDAALRPWHIGTTSLRLRRTSREQTDTTTDRRFVKVLFKGNHAPIRPGVILSNMKLRPRQLFSYDNYQESLQKVHGTGVFSNVDFQFTPRTDSDTLDLLLDCVLDKPYDFYVETNFVNRTIGRLGPEMKVGVTRRNAFRGGEKLNLNLHGSYEWETSSKGSNMNSYLYGFDASIEFPRILIPRFKSRTARMADVRRNADSPAPRRRRRTYYSTPWTIAKVSSDVIYRPDYYKMHIVSGEWTYRWQPSLTSRHELSPLTVKYQFMNSWTEEMEELASNNLFLAATLTDVFIPKMRYTYTYVSPSNLRHPVRWETTVEEAGNLTALYDVLVQGHGWNQKYKTFFKNAYSQFLKIETDLSKTWTLSSQSQLVGHVNIGKIWYYGNSASSPFSEMFYVGGANTVRAFPVRSIGPGAFWGGFDNKQFSYIMQNGDMKLVMNLELRQRLFGNLYGAVFLDVGNVWASDDRTISEDDLEDFDPELRKDYVEAWNEFFADINFRFNKMFKQLATGTGIGLRYDLDFLVLRVDWGFGLHLPYNTGKSGYFNIPSFKDMHTLHIAIGYPF